MTKWGGAPGPQCMAMPVAPHTWGEVRQALMSMKTGKAAKPGELPAEVWQALEAEVPRDLARCFDKAAWDECPLEWAVASLVWLKKPNKPTRTPDGYRDICLMDVVAKAYSRCVLNRIAPELYRGILPNQFGFVPGRSTTDALTVVRDLQVRCSDVGVSLMMASLDLTQAFYKIDRTKLQEVVMSRLWDEATGLQVCRRYDTVVYRLHQGTSTLELECPGGS